MPDDRRKKLDLILTNPSAYIIEKSLLPLSEDKTNANLQISLDDHQTAIRKKKRNDPSAIIVKQVPAGRGFHWEKTLDIAFPGNMKIMNMGGHLLLINEVYLEDYLSCVAVSEMSPQCPAAFLEAQTIAARSWILAAAEKKHEILGLDACNDDCCQRYQGIGQMTKMSKTATENTRGIVLIYENIICDARYSKSCGGLTENANSVWNMQETPYLKSIYDGPNTSQDIDWNTWFTIQPNAYCSPHFVNESTLSDYLGKVDKKGSYFRWQVQFEQNEFCDFFSKKVSESVKHIHKIDALERGHSGRIMKLYINYETEKVISKTLLLKSEYEIRKTLHPSFLYSSCFSIEMDEKSIQFNGAGWGHGVGLCQIGALGMALAGFNSHEILKHYYSNTDIRKIY